MEDVFLGKEMKKWFLEKCPKSRPIIQTFMAIVLDVTWKPETLLFLTKLRCNQICTHVLSISQNAEETETRGEAPFEEEIIAFAAVYINFETNSCKKWEWW